VHHESLPTVTDPQTPQAGTIAHSRWHFAAGWYFNNPDGQPIFRNGFGARFQPRTMSANDWSAAVEAGELTTADKAPADNSRAGPVAYGEGSSQRWHPVITTAV
jgi:hypothetical protein